MIDYLSDIQILIAFEKNVNENYAVLLCFCYELLVIKIIASILAEVFCL